MVSFNSEYGHLTCGKTFLQNKLSLEKAVALFLLTEIRIPLMKILEREINGGDFLLVAHAHL